MTRSRVVALAVLLAVAALFAGPIRATGEGPSSIGLYWADGMIGCHATPMPSGLYVAAHCMGYGGQLATIGGVRWPYSVDPLRDLAHIAAPPYAAPGAVLRAPVVGEAVEWRNTRGVGGGMVAGTWWSRGPNDGGDHEWYAIPTGAAGEWQARALCHGSGRRVIRGDSGSGVWATSDGALVGIVTAASLDDWTDSAGPCGGRQWIIAVQVP